MTTSPMTGVEWRRLNRVLWVGRRDGHHVGMIEQGKDYVTTDGEGVVLGRFRDLAEAKASFGVPLQDVGSSADAQRPRRRAWPYVTGGGALLIAAAGVTGAVLIH